MRREFRPDEFGLVKLPIPVPPNLERALGYPGNERYLAFHECRVSRPGLFIEDADHEWPGVEAGWSLFCKHPAIARVLEALRLDLKRIVPTIPWDEWISMPPSQRQEFWSRTRYLVLDRQDRILYVGTHSTVRMFLIIEPASREPEAEDDIEITADEFEVNVQSEELGEDLEKDPIFDKEPALAAAVPVEISRGVLEKLRIWLDKHEPVDHDYIPGATESCGFQRTNVRVEPGQIEDAFGYRGGKRYISLHWSPKASRVFVCDGIGRWSFSEAVATWNQFLDHPLVKPHLQGCDQSKGEWRTAQIDFSAEVGKLPECPLFSSEQIAREMEADVNTNCLLYDRAGNEIYSGSWASALFFHSLVEELLEEDLVGGPRPEAVPLLTWLNERLEDPEHVFAVAASYNQHHQEQDALGMLRRCIELDPTSHNYWCRLSQTLGSLSRWEDALDACENALAFHASAPRQDMRAEYMLKWKAECLFMLQRYSEAADTYRFVIEIDNFSDKADSYSRLARCYEKMGACGEAVVARELQVRDVADSFAVTHEFRESDGVDAEIVDDMGRFSLGEAWLDLGRCYVLGGNVGGAEWALRMAIDVAVKSVRARAELGVLLQRLGRIEEAMAQFQEALALATAKIKRDPTFAYAHSDLAFVYRAMGNSEAAEQAEQRAVELGRRSNDEERRVVSMEGLDQHGNS